jgi:hypothetical protein
MRARARRRGSTLNPGNQKQTIAKSIGRTDTCHGRAEANMN